MSTVHSIFIAPQATGETQSAPKAQLIAGKGVVGDRYYLETGTFSEQLAGKPDRELTLIESEQIDRFNAEQGFSFSYGDFRRNIVTQGVNLNDLAGKEFTLGSARLRGIRLCEPCAHLAQLLTPDIMPALVHKSGLRAQILSDGEVCAGDALLA